MKVEPLPAPRGRFGGFGGQFVPEVLMPSLAELEDAYAAACADPAFGAQLDRLLSTYVGRPTPLYRAVSPRRLLLVRSPRRSRRTFTMCA